MKVKELILILKELSQSENIIFLVDDSSHFISEVKACAYVVHENGEDIKKTELEPNRIEIILEKN